MPAPVPHFLGILNLTPDSFSDGGKFLSPEAALEHARALVTQGASFLDVGAESTRPGAQTVDAEEEWQRLEPVLRLLARHLPHIPISLDTRHASVAERGLGEGVKVLNDVTGFRNPAMLRVAASCDARLIAMRSRMEGDRFWMPPYDQPGSDHAEPLLLELEAVRDRLRAAGITPDRVLLDPGFGFGTTWSEDQALWRALPTLPQRLAWPVTGFCIAISRKRFTAWMAGDPTLPPQVRDASTTRLHQEAFELGFRWFRSHIPHPLRENAS